MHPPSPSPLLAASYGCVMQLVQEQLVLQQLEVLQLQQLEQLELLLVAPANMSWLTSVSMTSKVSKYSACSSFLSSAAFRSRSIASRENMGLGSLDSPSCFSTIGASSGNHCNDER
jgi:hypothetical protein